MVLFGLGRERRKSLMLWEMDSDNRAETGGIQKMKANTMIPVFYDRKQSKVCMMNVETRQFYFHYQRFEQISTVVLAAIGLGLSRLARSLRPELYLYNPTLNFKILLILVSVFAGILLLWLSIKKRDQPQFEEYMSRDPTPEEVKSTADIPKILTTAQLVMLLIIFLSIGLAIGSIILFSRFFDDSNLATYALATTVLLGCSYFSSRIDQAIFILKSIANMKSDK